MTIILLGILGMIISIAIGWFWYSLKTPMGRIQQQAVGHGNLSKEEQIKLMEEMKPSMWKYLLAQAFLALLTSIFIAFIMIAQKGMGAGVIYGEVGMAWLCFTVPIVGQSLLWGNCDKSVRWKKFFSDILSNLVTYFVIILVFSFII
jgi:hypothetical protein